VSASDPSAGGLPLAGGGGGASAPSGTGVVTATGGAFVTPVASAATTRATLGLGGAAVLAVGTTAGTVAAGDDSRITGAIAASTLTTRGDLLRRGASAPERFAAVTSGNVVAGNGTDVVSVAIATPLAVNASGNRTALGLGGAAVLNVGTTAGTVAAGDALSSAGLSTTPAVGQTAADGNLRAIDPSATGSATTAGVGTASASAASVTLSLDGTTLSTWYSGTYNSPRCTITPQSAWSAPAISPHRFQATARIVSRAGTGGAVFTNTVAVLGLDGGTTLRYGIYAKGSTVGSENESSSGATGIVSTTGAGLAWDGNDWLRIRVDGAQITFYFGRGAGGAAPAETAFVAIGSTTYTVPANFAGFAVVLLLVQSTTATGGSGPTIVFDTITIRRLP